MKKIVSIVLILMMMTGVFADTAVPTLYSELPFGLTQEGDVFTIILDENPTTGYTWSYVVSKEDHVKFISDEYITESNLMGAAGKHHYTFEVLADGVSTIEFTHNRSFEENSTIDTIDVLVYKNGEKVFVEENGIVTINEPVLIAEPVLISEPVQTGVVVAEKMLKMDTAIQTIDGVTMVPVAETLRALGYDVKWVSETQSIEISKGAQWTSITLGKNAYFKNRMAARPLSAAPVIYNDRAMVPAEFFNVILDLGIQVEDGQIEFNEYDMSAYSGYIKEIKVNDKGVASLFLTYEEGAEMVDVVIHTSSDRTFVQGSIKVGDYINALTSMATTMSIPPQTAGYIIY